MLLATDAAGEGINLQAGAPDGEIRPALKPEPSGAPFRPDPPDRPDQGLPSLELRRAVEPKPRAPRPRGDGVGRGHAIATAVVGMLGML